MLLERAPSSEPDKTTSSIPEKSRAVGNVALTDLVNTDHQDISKYAKLNGHGVDIPYSYRTSLLIRETPKTGELEIAKQHSAQVAGLLELHMEVKIVREKEGSEPTNRLFAFVHATTGEFYDNVRLEQLFKRRLDTGLDKHTAVFTYPNEYHDDRKSIEALIVPIDDIYCINYAMPKKESI